MCLYALFFRFPFTKANIIRNTKIRKIFFHPTWKLTRTSGGPNAGGDPRRAAIKTGDYPNGWPENAQQLASRIGGATVLGGNNSEYGTPQEALKRA